MEIPQRVYIFDTTLRDGEQSPGVALTASGKLAIAEQLARLDVDAIKEGLPKSSAGDFAAVNSIAGQIVGPVVAVLARCQPTDLEVATRALEPALKLPIHVFIATSSVHMQIKLKMSLSQVLDRIGDTVTRRAYVEDVGFSVEHATRSHGDFLLRAALTAVECGASIINLPDAAGYAISGECGRLLEGVRASLRDRPATRISVHCHNDLGLAVANTLVGIGAGAGQVEVVINGIGERVGNVAWEEVVIALSARHDQCAVSHRIRPEEIDRTSQLVSQFTGMLGQPNKAIGDRNAVRQQSGIHQDGVLKDRCTYEIVTPEAIDVGKTALVLGKHSGRHALRKRLANLGIVASTEELDRIQTRMKSLAKGKFEVNDAGLTAIWQDQVQGIKALDAELTGWEVSTDAPRCPSVRVTLGHQGTVRDAGGTGNGAVDTLFEALVRAFEMKDIELRYYCLVPESPGEDGMAAVGAQVFGQGLSAGYASDPDVLKASALAIKEVLDGLAGPRLASGAAMCG